jgi:DNA polymerase elongation subunit (family B)
VYQSISYNYQDRKCYLRDDEKGWLEFEYTPTYYKVDPKGKFKTLDGKIVSPTKYADKSDPINNYELDIPMDTRILIDLYKDLDDAPKFHKIGSLDIECEIGGALTTEYIKNAPSKLTAIALYDKTTKEKICYILDEEKRMEISQRDDKIIIPCSSEEELVLKFLDKWEELDFTIITGWNSGFFDIPYLYYRISRIINEETARRLSPLRRIKIVDYDIEQPVVIEGINHLDYMLLFKKFIVKQEPSYKLGVIGEKYVKLSKIEYEGSLDKLFKEDINKFIDYNVRDVEILVALEEKMKFIELTVNICHLCHVPYEQIYYSTVLNEGAILTYLKRKDIVSPNKPTTINPDLKENLSGMKKSFKRVKTKLRKLVLEGINSNTEFLNFLNYYELRSQIEGEYIKLYNKKGDFLFHIFFEDEELQFEFVDDYAGGYLKNPIPGLYKWLSDLDYTSLYPSIIRNLNMGIETLLGRIRTKNKYDNHWGLSDLKKMDQSQFVVLERVNENRKIDSTNIRIKELVELIEQEDLIIAANGTLFRRDSKSIVVEILNDWFQKRKEFKDLMKKAYKEGNKELGDFYDKRQHAMKIKLNDVYGVFAINGWRYTDGNKFISSAITTTGQRLDQEAINFINEQINLELGINKDNVVTADTDSLFFELSDLVLKKNPNIDLSDRQQVIPVALEITKEYQDKTKILLQDLSKNVFNVSNIYFELKQEVILERGYFAGKRRYAMFIVNKEGVPVEELDMKGLDIMKSNMTPIYKKFGESIILDIMYGKTKQDIDKKVIEFKSKLKDLPYQQVAKPTGVKKIKEYIASPPTLGEVFSKLATKCPINTKAAIFYNDLLRFKQLDKKYSCLTEGDKMYYIQLKDNPFKLEVLGFTGNDPEFINEFLEKYADRELGWESVLLNKLTSIYEDLSWEFPSFNNNIKKFFKYN